MITRTLQDVWNKRRGREKIVSFLFSHQSVIKTGDAIGFGVP